MQINLWLLKRHIRRCKTKGVRFNFLGFVENKDLTSEVESLFSFCSPSGYCGYDWINGKIFICSKCKINQAPQRRRLTNE